MAQELLEIFGIVRATQGPRISSHSARCCSPSHNTTSHRSLIAPCLVPQTATKMKPEERNRVAVVMVMRQLLEALQRLHKARRSRTPLRRSHPFLIAPFAVRPHR